MSRIYEGAGCFDTCLLTCTVGGYSTGLEYRVLSLQAQRGGKARSWHSSGFGQFAECWRIRLLTQTAEVSRIYECSGRLNTCPVLRTVRTVSGRLTALGYCALSLWVERERWEGPS